MRKLLLVLFIATLIGCSSNVGDDQIVNDPTTTEVIVHRYKGTNINGNLFSMDIYENDIHYKVITTYDGIYVINVTLDSLQILVAQKQL